MSGWASVNPWNKKQHRCLSVWINAAWIYGRESFIQLILVEWQRCREKNVPLEGSSVLGQWLQRLTCAPGAGLCSQGKQTRIQGSPLPLFHKRKIGLNRDHPLPAALGQGSKHLPVCSSCCWFAQHTLPRARRVLVFRHPRWFCIRHRDGVRDPELQHHCPCSAGCCQLSMSSYSPLQICCYGEKSQALNIELPVISAGICCVQVSVGVYLNK